MTTNNDFTTTNGNGTIGIACNYLNSCGYKLPCGLCRLLMSQCPKDFSLPNITWTKGNSTVTNPREGAATNKVVMNNE